MSCWRFSGGKYSSRQHDDHEHEQQRRGHHKRQLLPGMWSKIEYWLKFC